MKKTYAGLSLLFILVSLSCNTRSWQQFNDMGVEELAALFRDPPVEYSLTFYWGWDGTITDEVIARDLDAFKARGVHIVTLESGYDMGSPYLSEGWFKLVQRTVELARERDMRVWIVDEGKYPSGFAGGKFTTDAPELRMKALVLEDKIELDGGDTLRHQVSADLVSAIAINRADSTNQILTVGAGEIQWTAPEGHWEVLLIKHDYRSSPTRAVNNPTRGKDPTNSLCDYLDPAATRKFIEFTHEEHKKYVGEEFGKTVLGFRGDEPDYSIRGIPWTTQLFEKFREQKGYDIQPYVASFFAPVLTEEQIRMKADYWDVWSDMFAANFFEIQADWCAENNLEYLVHLNKEDNMMSLIDHEGDFFKCMRYVQMPGVDAIWNQIWPGRISDYPKYASSVAHVYGKPRAFTESFAAYHTPPNVAEAKWVLDYQFVRGINMTEIMFVPASSKGNLGLRGWTAAEEFPEMARYIHRASCLLSQGRPTAQIAVYHPTTSMWLGNRASNESTLSIMRQLLETQRDFDFVDEYALSTALSLKAGKFINASGQYYTAVIVPSSEAMSKSSLERLKVFASEGGRVLFLGSTPSMVVENTFLHASGPPDLSWAMRDTSGNLNNRLLGALPHPDVSFSQACPSVKYVHRKLSDADLYFFFNESKEKQLINAELAGIGQVMQWDALSGEIKVLQADGSTADYTRIQLEFAPWEAKFIVLSENIPGM